MFCPLVAGHLGELLGTSGSRRIGRFPMIARCLCFHDNTPPHRSTSRSRTSDRHRLAHLALAPEQAIICFADGISVSSEIVQPCRCSSAVEQGTHKPLVARSNRASGTTAQAWENTQAYILLRRRLLWQIPICTGTLSAAIRPQDGRVSILREPGAALHAEECLLMRLL